jgi:hypothetical protein
MGYTSLSQLNLFITVFPDGFLKSRPEFVKLAAKKIPLGKLRKANRKERHEVAKYLPQPLRGSAF